jgi:hypothetical protein
VNQWWMNWKSISLFSIVVITVAPFVGIVFTKAIFPEMKIVAFSRMLSTEECSFETNEKCSKGMLFEPIKLVNDQNVIPGFSNYKAHVRCFQSQDKKDLKPVLVHDTNLVFSDSLNQCEKGILVFFIQDRDPASSSWIIPTMVIEKEINLLNLSRSIRFWRSEFRTIVSAMAPLQVILTTLLLVIMSGVRRHRYFYSFIVVSLTSFLNGFIFERSLFLPDIDIPQIKEFLGWLLLFIFFKETFTEKWKNVSKRSIVFASLCIVSFFHLFKITANTEWTLIVSGWGLLAVLSRFSFLSTVFFICHSFYLLSVLTPIGIVPQYAATLFFMIYFIGSQIERVRAHLVNTRINQFVRGINAIHDVKALIKMIGRVQKVNKVTLSLVKSDSFEHWVFKRGRHRVEKLITHSDSQVISKIYVSRKPLVNIDSSSEFGSKLSTRPSQYQSKFFSSFPVHVNGEIFAVISFTEYSDSFYHPDAFDYIGEIFYDNAEMISRALSQINQQFSMEVEESFISSVDSSKEPTFELQIHEALNSLYDQFGISGYFSEIKENNSISLLSSSGSLVEVMSEINSMDFKLKLHNEFGPISIAFKDNEPVVIQNWKPLSDQLSQAAMDVYRKTGANSILTVPVVFSLGRVQYRYLVWLQSNASRNFTIDFIKVGKTIRNKLIQIISRQVSLVFEDTVFSNVDSEVIKNVVHGRNSTIQENGELVMVDLGRSTLLSQKLSLQEFSDLKNFYQSLLVDHLSRFNYKLQMVSGDALLFTRSDSFGVIDRVQLLSVIDQCDAELKSYYSSHLSEFASSPEPALRVCSVFGDITCDMVKGSGGGWTIIGSTINEVHKLEAVAKKFRNGIYFELDHSSAHRNLNFQVTDIQPWVNAPKMRFIQYSELSMLKAG